MRQFHFSVRRDINAPTVALIAPNIHDPQISTIPSLQLRFSEEVENVNNTTIALHEGSRDGPVVPVGSLTAGDDNTYTFSPPGTLKGNTTYCIVVSKAITDESGNPLLPMDFCFTTGTVDAPVASLISPSNNAQSVSTHPTIQLRFSTPVQNVNPNTVVLHEGAVTGPVVMTGSLVAGGNNTYTFSPTRELKAQTLYSIVLSRTITGAATGTPLIAEQTFTFTTSNSSGPGPVDTTPPTVSLLTPTNNATHVSMTPNIQLKFSEAVLNVSPNTVTLHEGSVTGALVATGQMTAGDNHTYTFSPTTGLKQQTLYYVVLSNAITDTSGNALGATNFSFTIGDFTAPIVSLVKPSNNATGVLTSPSIQLQFSEAVLNVNSSTVTLREGSATGPVIATGAIVSGTNNTYTFSPVSDLKQQTLYYVVLSKAITDISGNALGAADLRFTVGDFTAPTVSLVTPTNNASNVTSHPVITLQFSEAMQNVSSSMVSLRKGDAATGSLVAIGSITAGIGNTYTFSPVTLLDALSTYYVVLGGSITDMAGNALIPPNLTFTTVSTFTWGTLGGEGAFTGADDFPRLATDLQGAPYIVYPDASSGNAVTVMKFDGSTWNPVGGAVSPGGGGIQISQLIRRRVRCMSRIKMRWMVRKRQ